MQATISLSGFAAVSQRVKFIVETKGAALVAAAPR